MTKAGRRLASIAAALAVALVITVLALFHGYFDRGLYEIEQAQWSSSNQVVMVAKRSDNDAMNGDEYFVLIGDHLFSPAELRHANYAHAVIFATDRNCVTVQWKDSRHLTVTCGDGSIEPGNMNVQLRRIGDVDISYQNIPSKISKRDDRAGGPPVRTKR